MARNWRTNSSFLRHHHAPAHGLVLVKDFFAKNDVIELVRNLVAHGEAREGKWRGNWRMEWVASTPTPPPNVVYPALYKLMRTTRLPAVDWTDAPTDLNELLRFGERRNLVSARVPSRSARAITPEHPLYLLTWLQLIFTSFLDWRDDAFVILLT